MTTSIIPSADHTAIVATISDGEASFHATRVIAWEVYQLRKEGYFHTSSIVAGNFHAASNCLVGVLLEDGSVVDCCDDHHESVDQFKTAMQDTAAAWHKSAHPD